MENNSSAPVSPPSSFAPPNVLEARSPSSLDVLSALMLLPPDAYALTASMGREDKEVLAFFIAREPDGDRNARHPREAAPGVGHRPDFNCECFECYANYWRRWHCSPAQNLIDQTMEAFDDHVAAKALEGGRSKEQKGEREEVKEKRGKKAEAEMFQETTDLDMEMIRLDSSDDDDDDDEYEVIAASDSSGGSEDDGFVVVKREEAAQAANSGRRRGRWGFGIR